MLTELEVRYEGKADVNMIAIETFCHIKHNNPATYEMKKPAIFRSGLNNGVNVHNYF